LQVDFKIKSILLKANFCKSLNYFRQGGGGGGGGGFRGTHFKYFPIFWQNFLKTTSNTGFDFEISVFQAIK
jgi:hypothetical protein